MTVVADATPLIGLAKIDHLHLLPSLFGDIMVPVAVYHELVVVGAGLPGAEQFSQSPWLQVRTVSDRLHVDYLRGDLDPGEAEALVLAQEVQANPLLVDEDRARTVAQLLNLPHIGTAGILVLAKQLDYISDVGPLIEQLRHHCFYLSNCLIEMILQQAGE